MYGLIRWRGTCGLREYDMSRVLYVGVGEWVFCGGVCLIDCISMYDSGVCRYPLVSPPWELRQEQGQRQVGQ